MKRWRRLRRWHLRRLFDRDPADRTVLAIVLVLLGLNGALAGARMLTR